MTTDIREEPREGGETEMTVHGVGLSTLQAIARRAAFQADPDSKATVDRNAGETRLRPDDGSTQKEGH